MSRSIRIVAGERQLFLDDYCIESTEGLQRRMQAPEKKGAVIRPEKPPEVALQNRCAPMWDQHEGKYKMLLVSGGLDGGTIYVESRDGIDWTRPTDHFITPDPKLKWPDNAMENVVYDPDDPDPGSRYKGFLGANERRLIASPDAAHWRYLSDTVLASGDESNLSYDRGRRTFLATLKEGGPHGRSQGIWTSGDFRSWTKVSVFSADDEDQRRGISHIGRYFSDAARENYNIPETYNVDIYNLGLFRYEGLYLGMPSMFHRTGKVDGNWAGFDNPKLEEAMRVEYKRNGDKGGFHHVQLMASRDLMKWGRLGDRQPFLDLSPSGTDAYDTNTLMPPSGPVIRDDELWLYYSGQKRYGFELSRHDALGRSAICLAVLRRDGFLSLDTASAEGRMLTRPFLLEGSQLNVNVDASDGNLEATVLDDRGKALAVSERVAGDRRHCQVRWKSGTLVGLRGRRIRLHFTMRDARFYSFWFDP